MIGFRAIRTGLATALGFLIQGFFRLPIRFVRYVAHTVLLQCFKVRLL